MNLPRLTDSHAHLDGELFNTDRDAVLKRAADAGVTAILNVALGPEREAIERAHALAVSREGIFLAVGVHPHDAERMTDETIPMLREFSKKDRVVAIGEIGLDFHYDHSPRDLQRKRFGELLDLALETGLPVSIHSREAFEDTYRALKEREIFRKNGGVLHCFTGTAEEAARFIDLGAYISFSGIVTFKKAANVQEAVRAVPAERMLIETDSPFLAPEPYRGKRNEPAYVARVAETVAALKGMQVSEVARITSDNAARLFRLM